MVDDGIGDVGREGGGEVVQPREAARSSGRAAIIGTVLTGVALQPVLILSGVLAARLLGVENRGELALLSLLPYVLSALGAMGVPSALTYFIADQPNASRELVRRVRPVMIAQLLVLPLVQAAMLWVLIAGSAQAGIVVAGIATLLVVPATLMQQYGLAILQGQHRYRRFNILRLAPAMLYALGMALAFVAGWTDLPTITGIWVLANVVCGAFTIAFAARHLDGSYSGEVATRGLIVRFGLRGLLGYVSPVENFRVDQAVVGFFLSSTALGIYVVGAAFTNLPRFVAQSVGMVEYPSVASQSDAQAALKVLLRFLALGTALAGTLVVTIEILAPWLIPFFYGSEFEPAVEITRILLIGALLLSVRRLVSDGLRGMGRPGVGTIGELVGWLFLLPCLLVLVPRFGLAGVAWSVTASWAASLAAVGIPLLRMLPILKVSGEKSATETAPANNGTEAP